MSGVLRASKRMPIGQEAAERSEGHRVVKRALESNEAFCGLEVVE